MHRHTPIWTILLVLLGCHADPLEPPKGQAPHQWISLSIPEAEAATPAASQASEPDPVSEEKVPVTAHWLDTARFLPRFVQVWTMLHNLNDVVLRTELPIEVQEEALSEISYRHPFAASTGSLVAAFRRVVAVDRKAHNWDMRDAIIMPSPSELSVQLPAHPKAKLSFSYLVVDSAFPGNDGGILSLRLALLSKEESSSSILGSITIDVRSRQSRTTWTPVEFDLPDLNLEAYTLAFNLLNEAGEEAADEGVAIGNLSLSVRRKQHMKEGNEVLPPEGPNVVVVFIDAARGDTIGPGNPGFPSVSPSLDALAEQGVTFTEAFSVSNQTRASIVGFLQSQHPTVGDFHSRYWRIKTRKIKKYYQNDPPLLPRLLRKAGYLTASIGRNHFQYGTSRMGLDPGFDMVWDNRQAQKDTVNIIRQAQAWLKKHRQQKFFLLVNISPPHQPYNAPEKYLEWTRKRLKDFDGPIPALVEYLAEIYYADQMLNELFETLSSLNLDDNTVVLITADHGETMHPSHSCHSEVFKTICHNSHGLTLYDEELHIPLIIKAPFLEQLKPGVRRQTVTHLDVAPTILDLVGLPSHPRHTGRSLVPDLLGIPQENQPVYAETRLSSAVRHNGWKFIYHHKKDDARTPAWKSGPKDTLMELYSLEHDPHESKNLLGKNLAMAETMRKLLRKVRTHYSNRVSQAVGKPWHALRRLEMVPEPPTLEEQRALPVDPASLGMANQNPKPAEPKPVVESVPIPEIPSENGSDNQKGNTEEPEETPETPTTLKSNGYLHFAFNREGEESNFVGEIKVQNGIWTTVEARQETSCLQVTAPDTLTVRCSVTDEPLMWRLQTFPAGASVEFQLARDGAPVDKKSFYVGTWGISLLDAPAIDSADDWSLAWSRRAPHVMAGFDGGVFAWSTLRTHSGSNGVGGSPEGGDFQGERIEDGATRSVLKNLGYWQ